MHGRGNNISTLPRQLWCPPLVVVLLLLSFVAVAATTRTGVGMSSGLQSSFAIPGLAHDLGAVKNWEDGGLEGVPSQEGGMGLTNMTMLQCIDPHPPPSPIRMNVSATLSPHQVEAVKLTSSVHGKRVARLEFLRGRCRWPAFWSDEDWNTSCARGVSWPLVLGITSSPR
jgi:hypothetical protein